MQCAVIPYQDDALILKVLLLIQKKENILLSSCAMHGKGGVLLPHDQLAYVIIKSKQD